MNKFLIIIVLLFLKSPLMADDNTVWVPDNNGNMVPIDPKTHEIKPPEGPVVPSVPERQVEPGILDDSAKFNTTVPEGAFGGLNTQNSLEQPEPQVIPNGTGSAFIELENACLQTETEFKAEIKKSEMKDAASYLPFIQNNRTAQFKSISEEANKQLPSSHHMRESFNDFRISQNARIDKFIYNHFTYELLSEKMDEGALYFNKPQLREKAKRDLIINVLLLSHFEGLGLEYTYRNTLTSVKFFHAYVAGGFFRANQEKKGEAYLKKNSYDNNKNIEKTLNETDAIIKELGLSFQNDKSGAEFLFEPIPQEKSASSQSPTTETLQSSSQKNTSP